MRVLFILLSTSMGILGLIFIIRGYRHPSTYQQELTKEVPTAVRVTQVYTEATHFVAIGIGIVSIGILIAFIGSLIQFDEWKKIILGVFRKTPKKPKIVDDADASQHEEHRN